MKPKWIAVFFSFGVTLLSGVLALYIHARVVGQSSPMGKAGSVPPDNSERGRHLAPSGKDRVTSSEPNDRPKQKRNPPGSRRTEAENLAYTLRRDTPEGLKGEIAKRRHRIIIEYSAFTREYLPEAEMRDKFWDALSDGEPEQVREVIGNALFEKFLEFKKLLPVRRALQDVDSAFSVGDRGETIGLINDLTLLLSRTPGVVTVLIDPSNPFPDSFISDASTILSADRLNTLKAVQARRIAVMEAEDRMSALQK
jgi:hypothetical protein